MADVTLTLEQVKIADLFAWLAPGGQEGYLYIPGRGVWSIDIDDDEYGEVIWFAALTPCEPPDADMASAPARWFREHLADRDEIIPAHTLGRLQIPARTVRHRGYLGTGWHHLPGCYCQFCTSTA